MKTNALFALFAAALLAGCVGGTTKNSVPVAIYDFGVPAQPLVADERWSAFALEVRSPPWFEALNIDYRLNYEDPLKQREYTASRWAGAPATLLGQRLRQQLGMQSPSSNALAECVLRVEVQEFSQVFDAPQQSRALVQGNASLVDAKRRLLAWRRIALERPAVSPDAHGGVIARDGRGGLALLEARQNLNRRLSDLERERFGWTHAQAAAAMALEAEERTRPVILERAGEHARAARERGRRDALVRERAHRGIRDPDLDRVAPHRVVSGKPPRHEHGISRRARARR